MNYDVDYFIRKFEAIPEDKWCTGSLMNQSGQRCAQGHCGPSDMKQGDFVINNECGSLCVMFGSVTGINNGTDSNYPQPTPKQRILAALYDVKKMQEPKHLVKVITKYVSVPETILENEINLS